MREESERTCEEDTRKLPYNPEEDEEEATPSPSSAVSASGNGDNTVYSTLSVRWSSGKKRHAATHLSEHGQWGNCKKRREETSQTVGLNPNVGGSAGESDQGYSREYRLVFWYRILHHGQEAGTPLLMQ